MEKMKDRNIFIYLFFVVFTFFLGAITMYLIISYYPLAIGENITTIKKNVTITDTGIGESVSKVYDSVVVVSTYRNEQLYGSGTGFVFKTDDKKAYILTNNHVIENGSKVSVTFTDGDVVETEIIGSNELSDIAVLAVSKDDIISIAEIGKSEELVVGDTTFAVGAPLDSVYSWSVTRGIISGKDRMIEVDLSNNSGEYVMKVLQTDAAINSGNSGGPLCNVNGEVIGITSLKLVSSGVEGMGFAIPIETAIEYANKIMNGEKITQPYLGVSMLNVSDAYYYMNYRNLLKDVSNGVIVVSVEKDSPASHGGLKESDIITKINGKDVLSVGYLRYYLYEHSVGEKIEVTYIRDGKEKNTTITLGTSEVIY